MTASAFNELRFLQISENAISIEWGGGIREETLQQITNINKCIRANPFSGWLSNIPAYTTLTVYFDWVVLMQDDSLSGTTALEKVAGYLKACTKAFTIEPDKEQPITYIPVCYEDLFGLDMEDLSSFYQLEKAAIVQLHCSPVYTVFMIGFVPGFPYLGGLPEKLTAPRKQQPRAAIPAGSVGIAGQQTGIYPLETPGGWQIIGRTPLRLFDVNRPQPSLLKAGDHIKFTPISFAEFEWIQQQP